ncbi:MAG: hypothetical protein KF716_20775 [Anaerolineae bacterium]|nr:hypothetical protein [Anaerolineae bacterium]
MVPSSSSRNFLIGRVIGVALLGGLLILFLRLLGIGVIPTKPVYDADKYLVDFSSVLGKQWQADGADQHVTTGSIGYRYAWVESLVRLTKHVEDEQAYILQEVMTFGDEVFASDNFYHTQFARAPRDFSARVGSVLGPAIERARTRLQTPENQEISCWEMQDSEEQRVICTAQFLCTDHIIDLRMFTLVQGRQKAAEQEVVKAILAVDEACVNN